MLNYVVVVLLFLQAWEKELKTEVEVTEMDMLVDKQVILNLTLHQL
jgi:hypothetical protein